MKDKLRLPTNAILYGLIISSGACAPMTQDVRTPDYQIVYRTGNVDIAQLIQSQPNRVGVLDRDKVLRETNVLKTRFEELRTYVNKQQSKLDSIKAEMQYIQQCSRSSCMGRYPNNLVARQAYYRLDQQWTTISTETTARAKQGEAELQKIFDAEISIFLALIGKKYDLRAVVLKTPNIPSLVDITTDVITIANRKADPVFYPNRKDEAAAPPAARSALTEDRSEKQASTATKPKKTPAVKSKGKLSGVYVGKKITMVPEDGRYIVPCTINIGGFPYTITDCYPHNRETHYAGPTVGKEVDAYYYFFPDGRVSDQHLDDPPDDSFRALKKRDPKAVGTYGISEGKIEFTWEGGRDRETHEFSLLQNGEGFKLDKSDFRKKKP
jgi:hypothetical protein